MKTNLPACLYGLLLLLGHSLVWAQNPLPTQFVCGGDEMQQQLWEKRPEGAAAQAQLDAQLADVFRQKENGAAARAAAAPLVLPVVVHIIHNGGSENIPDAQVADAIQHLNDAFAHSDYYATAGAGVETGIQFCLALRTPDGLATTGINRVASALTQLEMESDDIPLKDLIRWDPTRYINIWVVQSISSLASGPGVAGYAYFPSLHGEPEDGIVCEAEVFGVGPEKEMVFIHEMGHYLGLYHTFEGGCKNDDCLIDGDRVCDTPPDQAKHTACPFNSCSTDADAPAPNPFSSNVNDMTENFMDDSPFECVYRFTQGQADRMLEVVKTVRESLLKSAGCQEACSPMVHADFSVTPLGGVLVGETANFTNNTTGGVGYEWFVEGTLVSTVDNPGYTFKFPGVFSIKLLATNGPQGCVDSFSMVYVVTCPVEAAFTADKTSVKEGESVLFTSTSTGGGTLEWFVNGAPAGSSPTLNFTFPGVGMYNVVLRATGGGCSDEFSMAIEVTSKCVSGPCPEICDNEKDDDLDGYVDCFDTDCQCFNGKDCLANNLDPDEAIEGKLAWWTPEGTACMISSPMVANLNPQTDTIPEVIVVRHETQPQIHIYKGDGSSATAPDVLTPLAGMDGGGNMPVIGDVNNDGIPELITVENFNKVRVYRNYTPNKIPCMSFWMASDLPTEDPRQRPMLADFDQDGQPEVYAGNDVFQFDFSNPAAPKLRLVLAGTGHSGRSIGNGATVSTAVDLLTRADCNGDPDCDGLELVAGSFIYSVDLDPLDGDGIQIKVARNLNTMQAAFKYLDGYTSVADVDLDGIPDIIVSGSRTPSLGTTTGIYVWNKNGLIRYLPVTMFPVATGFNGLTAIANVYDDRKSGYAKDYPEIIIIGTNRMDCFNLNKANTTPAAPSWWILPNTDESGITGCTTFDFNGDGIQEIVYRDHSDLRIIYGGAAPFPPGVDAQRNWWKTTVGSGTADEIPVIADVNNDGHADIAVTGFDKPHISPTPPPIIWDGRLQVFTSAKIPWMPCRPIWNQFNYNYVNINDDLTVPKVQQKHWLEFPGPGGGKYPYNTALAQLSPFNSNFTTGYPVPDVVVSLDTFFCSPNGLSLQVHLCNSGSVAFPDSMPLQFYGKNPTSTAVAPHGTPFFLKGKLAKDSCRTWSIDLPMPPDGALWGIVNDNGSLSTPFDLTKNFPSTAQLECNYVNNIFNLNISTSTPTLDLGPDRNLCSSSVLTLQADAGFVRYRWNDGSPASTFTVFGPGKYWVDAWDICGKKYSDTLRITLQNTTIELGPDRSICRGDSIQLALAGFDQVQWSPPPVFICPDCASVALAPDSSVVLRVSGQVANCIVSDSVRVQVHGLPEFSSTITNGNCFTENGSIAVTAVGGNSGVTFNWENGQNTATLGNVPAGTYQVTVTNAMGCSASKSYEILAGGSPLLTDTSYTAIRCFSETSGGIAVTAAGGSAPYQFAWSHDPTAAGSSQTSLAAGVYSVTISDVNGCTSMASFELTEPSALVLMAVMDSTDCQKTTASISTSAVGGSEPYSFTWNTGAKSPNLNNQPPGVYSVVLTDANGCTSTHSFEVKPGGSPLLTDTAYTAIRCFADHTGGLAVTPAGGTGPYQYVWSHDPMATGSSQTALAAGIYSLTITDTAGCSSTASFQLPEPPALVLTATMDSTNCQKITANMAASAAGGTAPYDYSWNTGAKTPDLNNQPPGLYNVVLTDANGCTATRSFEVKPGGSPLLADTTYAPIRCFSEQNGGIAVAPAGGTAPYHFTWSHDPTATGNSHTALAAGTYGLTVTDTNGCSTTASFQLAEPPALVLTATMDSTDCQKITANMIASAAGGTAPYTYTWNTGAKTPDLNNQPPGLYHVVAADANGCTSSRSFEVKPGGSPLLVDTIYTAIRCFAEKNGAISITTTGGVEPYHFGWSHDPNTTSNSQIALAAGSYSLTITDTNGCSSTASFQLTEPPALVLTATMDSTDCQKITASMAASAAGGTAPYTYTWNTGAKTPDLNNQSPGLYSVVATDANGCTSDRSFEVKPGGSPLLVDTIYTAIRCFSDKNGAISVATTGGVAPYHFGWSHDPTATSNSQTALAAGSYSLTITDTNGCSSTASFQLTEPPVLVLTATMDSTDCQKITASMSASAAGGTAPYTYIWNTGAKTPDLNNQAPGAYNVVLTDANGCTSSRSFEVKPGGSPLLVDTIYTAIRCFADKNGGISVATTGGVAPYHFIWSHDPTATSNSQTGLAAGTYSLTITDTNGCSSTTTFQLSEPPVLSLTAVMDSTDCQQTTASISASAVGGSMPYTFTWNTGAKTPDLNNQPPGTYIVVLTDANGCTTTRSFEVKPGGSPLLNLKGENLNCLQTSAVLTAGPVFPNLSFQWTSPDGNLLSGPQQLVSQAGFYQVTVTDLSSQCSATSSIEVKQAAALTGLSWMADSVSCFGFQDGALTVTNVQGGTGPFEYSIENQSYTSEPVFEQLAAGVYTLQVRDAEGCTFEQTVQVSEPAPLTVVLTASDTVVRKGALVELIASIQPPDRFLTSITWQPLGRVSSNGLTAEASVARTTAFQVLIADENGCTAEDSVQIKVKQAGFYFPNAIAPDRPNNGGFTIYGDHPDVKVKWLRVYSRWGELIFERSNFPAGDATLGWQGDFKGKKVQVGVYIFTAILVLEDGTEHQLEGDITVF